MHHVKALQKLGKRLSYALVDRRRAKAAAHYHHNGLASVKAHGFKALFAHAVIKLRANGGARVNHLLCDAGFGKRYRVLERDAYGVRIARGDLVGKARGIVRFVAYHGAFAPCRHHNGHAHKAAL